MLISPRRGLRSMKVIDSINMALFWSFLWTARRLVTLCLRLIQQQWGRGALLLN